MFNLCIRHMLTIISVLSSRYEQFIQDGKLLEVIIRLTFDDYSYNVITFLELDMVREHF